MRTLKSESFLLHETLTKFINDNNINKDDILNIATPYDNLLGTFVMFYYSDSEIDQKKSKGFWG